MWSSRPPYLLFQGAYGAPLFPCAMRSPSGHFLLYLETSGVSLGYELATKFVKQRASAYLARSWIIAATAAMWSRVYRSNKADRGMSYRCLQHAHHTRLARPDVGGLALGAAGHRRTDLSDRLALSTPPRRGSGACRCRGSQSPRRRRGRCSAWRRRSPST